MRYGRYEPRKWTELGLYNHLRQYCRDPDSRGLPRGFAHTHHGHCELHIARQLFLISRDTERKPSQISGASYQHDCRARLRSVSSPPPATDAGAAGHGAHTALETVV